MGCHVEHSLIRDFWVNYERVAECDAGYFSLSIISTSGFIRYNCMFDKLGIMQGWSQLTSDLVVHSFYK